jgi:hypothetical protein
MSYNVIVSMAMNLWIIAFVNALISLFAALIHIRFLAIKIRISECVPGIMESAEDWRAATVDLIE